MLSSRLNLQTSKRILCSEIKRQRAYFTAALIAKRCIIWLAERRPVSNISGPNAKINFGCSAYAYELIMQTQQCKNLHKKIFSHKILICLAFMGSPKRWRLMRPQTATASYRSCAEPPNTLRLLSLDGFPTSVVYAYAGFGLLNCDFQEQVNKSCDL
jgi:hypothetical protein